MSNYYGYRRYYGNHKDAANVLNRLKDIAYTYGHCTVADLMELYDRGTPYTDSRRVWTVDDLKKARVCYTGSSYYLNLPEPQWVEMLTDDLVEHETITPEPQPLNIVLHTNEVPDPNAALAEIFKHIQTIKDRTINISIM